MIIPNYITYCVKCGEYGHIGKSCKNIDENKMNIIINNHQHAFMRTLYGTFPSLSNDINHDGEYQCKECNRVFRKYKYFIYHDLYFRNVCNLSKLERKQSPNTVILK